MERLFRGFVNLAVLVLLAAPPAYAQATAQITGVVADSQGAVLPGVDVTAVQTDTGFKRSTVTDTSGSYTLTNLPLGPYRVEATLSGFRAFVRTGLVLQVNANPVVNITLALGDLSETISVQAATPLIERAASAPRAYRRRRRAAAR